MKPTIEIDIKEKAFELINQNIDTNAVETKI
jgi:cytochrome c oxidase cbb3-type subunit 1